jgi:hypothetical protein
MNNSNDNQARTNVRSSRSESPPNKARALGKASTSPQRDVTTRESRLEPVYDPETVLALARGYSDSHESVFDRSLGVSDACFSARRLVALIDSGLSSRSFKHLISCPTCLENLSALHEVALKSAPGFVERASKMAAEAGAVPLNVLSASHHSTELTAILGRISQETLVTADTNAAIEMDFSLIPVFPNAWLNAIDETSLRVDGAIVSGEVSIEDRVDVSNDGTPDFLRLCISHGVLASRVRDKMTIHNRVGDLVRLHGGFKGRSIPDFSGQMRVEFMHNRTT